MSTLKINIRQGSFLLLTVLVGIIFCNLNGILFSQFGIVAPLSPVIFVLCILILILSLPKVKYSLGLKLYFVFFFAYLSLATISGIYHYFLNSEILPSKLYRDYATAVIVLLTFYSGFYLALKHNHKKTIKMISIFLAFTMIFAIIEFFSKSVLMILSATKMDGRALGFFGNPNELGSYGNFGIVWFLFLANESKGIYRFININLIVVAIAVTCISVSKSAILGGIIILLLFILLKLLRLRQSSSSGKILTVTAFVCILLVTLQLGPILDSVASNFEFGTRERIESLSKIVLEGKVDRTTTTHRTTLWSEALDRILENPFIGSGIGSMHKLKGLGLGVHNIYLMIMGESGILGLLLFFLFIFYYFTIGLSEYNFGFQFLILGFGIIFFGQYCMSAHYILYNKISLGFLSILLSMIAINKFKPTLLYET